MWNKRSSIDEKLLFWLNMLYASLVTTMAWSLLFTPNSNYGTPVTNVHVWFAALSIWTAASMAGMGNILLNAVGWKLICIWFIIMLSVSLHMAAAALCWSSFGLFKVGTSATGYTSFWDDLTAAHNYSGGAMSYTCAVSVAFIVDSCTAVWLAIKLRVQANSMRDGSLEGNGSSGKRKK